MRGRAVGAVVVGTGALVGVGVGGWNGGWAGHVGGKGGAMVASSGWTVEGRWCAM
jgi:hypothetical protein